VKKTETLINSISSNKFITFSELYKYRDLLYFMVLREVKVLYKQTVLGFSWAIIRPTISMIIFSIIFGNLAQIPSDGIPYPIFSYTALVPWTYFSTALTSASTSLVKNTSIFTKVYFPRLIIPITPVISGLVDFLISMSIVFVLMIYYGISVTTNIIWLPVLIFIMILTSAGLGFWFSALAVQFRDIRYAVQFLSQLLMYAAPVVWPASLLSEKFGEDIAFWYGLYPLVGVIEGFRSALIGKVPMPLEHILLGSLTSFIIFISGSFYFNKREKFFTDVA
tara:strand:- start:651 stop:1487 length:837 start_codon:yes stop_codon:yes gene_type:complete